MSIWPKIFKPLKFIIIGLILLILFLGAAFYWECSIRPKLKRGETEAKYLKYEQLIKTELPKGSSAYKVVKFLASYTTSHTNYKVIKSNEKIGYPLWNLNLPNKEKIIKGYIHGSLMVFTHSCLVTCDRLMMDFYFDNNDKLVTHVIEWGCTGP